MNILVRMPNWIGDVVMATPVLRDIRKAFPEASITAMVKKPLASLLEREEAIDEVFAFEKPEKSPFRRKCFRDIVKTLEVGRYDIGILLTHSFSSAWWFWQGGVKKRIGYRKNARSFLLSDPIDFPAEKEHLVISYKRLLAPLNIPISQTPPKLFCSEEEKRKAMETLLRKGHKRGRKLIAIHPFAVFGPAKCWPEERFFSLIQELGKFEDLSVVLFGDERGKSFSQSLARRLPPNTIDLIGATTLKELVFFTGIMDLAITNDSGPMHIAAALDVPLVSLFGSTDETLTGPWGQKEGIIRKKVPCSPCFKRICPIDFPCMRNIEVKEVLEKVMQNVSNV